MTDFTGPNGLREFDRLVIEWAKERGLCSPDNLKNQVLKLVEEVGETELAIRGLDYESDFDSVVDGVGDCLVVLSILCNQVGVNFADTVELSGICAGNNPAHVGQLCGDVVRGRDCRDSISRMIWHVCNMAERELSLPIDFAMSAAWEAIKDRQGVTVDGVFRKEGE